MPMDDPALVESLRSGDPQAPRLLIERYQGVVFGLCYRMMNHQQDAEDVTQETFIRALRAMPGFDATRPIRPWLLEIAANRCRTALRQRPRTSVGGSLNLNQAVAPSTGESRDLADELETAVCELRDDYRLCFLLFYQEDLSCAEIANVMNCPEGTVKTWLHRARRELADRLRRRGVVPHVEYQLH